MDSGVAGTPSRVFKNNSEVLLLLRYKLNVSFKAGFDITHERNTLTVKFIVQLEYIFRLQFNEMLELSRDVRKTLSLEL